MAVAALALGLALSAPIHAPAHARGVEAQAEGWASDREAAPATQPARRPSGVAAQMADWVAATDDNRGRPFAIIDKLAAEVFVFDADGRLRGAAPALVGLAPGDDSAPGLGARALSEIPPDERTTPAGRFIAHFGAASGHYRTVLWVDYADGISMHPVITSNPNEHRLRRIKSASPREHRISFGCINVPARFYEDVVQTAFAGGRAVVYILPDTRPLEEVFPAFAASVGDGGDRRLSQEIRSRGAADRIVGRQQARYSPVGDP
jgi:hypothetical protein